MMRLVKHIVLGALVLCTLLLGCKKDDIAAYKLSPEKVVIYDNDNISYSVGAVAGNGTVLLCYLNVFDQYRFKLVDNEGNELWDKYYGFSFSRRGQSYRPHISALYDEDETFAIFFKNGLYKVNMQGELIFSDSLFLAEIGFDPKNYNELYTALGINNNYLVMGTIELSGIRAFVGEFSRMGNKNFLKYFPINLTTASVFTSGFANADGGYTLGGHGKGNGGDSTQAIFVTKISANGTILKNNQTTVYGLGFTGHDLIQQSNGNLGYVISPANNTSADNRSRIYALDAEGVALGFDFIDLAKFNYAPGNPPFFGEGLVRKDDGSFIGLMMPANGDDSNPGGYIYANYTQPSYAYYYMLDRNAKVVGKKYINRAYSNNYTAIVKMSNGKTMLFGTTLSLGENVRLTTIIN